MVTRRSALGLLGIGTGFGTLGARRRLCRSFPSRAMNIVVPYPAGGPVETVAWLYADEAAADLVSRS